MSPMGQTRCAGLPEGSYFHPAPRPSGELVPFSYLFKVTKSIHSEAIGI